MNSKGCLVMLFVISFLHISVAGTGCVRGDEESCAKNQNWPVWVGHYFTQLVLNRLTAGLAVGTVLLALLIIFIAMTCFKQNKKDELPLHVVPVKHNKSSQGKRFTPEVDDDGFVSIDLHDGEDKTQDYCYHNRGQVVQVHHTVIQGNGEERVIIWR